MWIIIDVLDAALVELCEFKVLIYCYSFCTQKILFHSILSLDPSISINDIRILWSNNEWHGGSPSGMEVRYLLLMWNKLTTTSNNNNNNNKKKKNVTGGANWIESNWIELESSRSQFENRLKWYQIPIQSNSNRILIQSDRIAPLCQVTSIPLTFISHY
jgi:hypothetical protein